MITNSSSDPFVSFPPLVETSLEVAVHWDRSGENAAEGEGTEQMEEDQSERGDECGLLESEAESVDFPTALGGAFRQHGVKARCAFRGTGTVKQSDEFLLVRARAGKSGIVSAGEPAQRPGRPADSGR